MLYEDVGYHCKTPDLDRYWYVVRLRRLERVRAKNVPMGTHSRGGRERVGTETESEGFTRAKKGKTILGFLVHGTLKGLFPSRKGKRFNYTKNELTKEVTNLNAN
jgi:hypothetical protein